MYVWYVLLNSTYLFTYLWRCRPAFERVFSGQYRKTENLPSGSIQVRLNNKLFRCHTTVGTHMPYGIMPWYLPPDRGDIPAFTPARLVLDLATLEGCKAELTYVAEIVHLPWDNISTLKLSLAFNLLRVVSHRYSWKYAFFLSVNVGLRHFLWLMTVLVSSAYWSAV